MAVEHQSRFLKQVIDTAIRDIDPQRIILYGSRARGSGRATSDYDIAFVGLRRPQHWSRFVLYLDEHAETLLPFDLIRYEDASVALQSQIDEDGVIIYERSED
jgi:predicted nucleotidyltransferase